MYGKATRNFEINSWYHNCIHGGNGRTILKKSGRQGFLMCTRKLIYVQICLPIITPSTGD